MRDINITKYRTVPFQKRTACQVCGKAVENPIIKLPQFPMTEIYTPKKVPGNLALCDQNFLHCGTCGHAQLSHVIDVNLQYGDSATYAFRTSESTTGSESADYFVRFIKHIAPKSLGKVAEIGCNDTYLLQKLAPVSKTLVGIDPVLSGKEQQYTKGNISVIGDFFEKVSFSERFDTILCKDTLEHIEHPKEFVRKIVDLGNPDTLYFFYHPFLETLLHTYRFDQIFHQHVNYFSLQSIIRMLDDLGCHLIDWKINFGHWGCIMYAFKKGKNTGQFDGAIKKFTPDEILSRYSIFKHTMSGVQAQLSTLAKEQEIIYGYGAANMLPVLGYHLENDFSSFAGILDENKKKDGMYWINLPVRITHPDRIKDIHNSSILVTAISSIGNTRAILAKLNALNPRRIIVPVQTF